MPRSTPDSDRPAAPHPSADDVRALAALPQIDDELLEVLQLLALHPELADWGDDPELDDAADRAHAVGLLRPDGSLAPAVRTAVLQGVSARSPVLRTRLADALERGTVLVPAARLLVARGLRDPRTARALVRAGERALATDPDAARALLDDAVRAGADELDTAVARAHAAAATGDVDTASRLVELVLEADGHRHRDRAATTAAALWAQRGQTARSADVHRWLQSIGVHHPASVIALLGTGAVADADAAFDAAERTPAMPSVATEAATAFARGMRASLDRAPDACLPLLVHASDLATAARTTAPLVELPAVVAALVAAGGGDRRTATTVLDDAIAGGQGGTGAHPRLVLMRALLALRDDRIDTARHLVAELGDRPLAPRDALLLAAVDVGAARRGDDGTALLEAWHRATQRLWHVSVDLVGLAPLAELVIAAARLRESARLEGPVRDALALLARVGEAPVWAAPFRWACVQAGILASQPADVMPHAAALVEAARISPAAGALAEASHRWVSALANQVDVAATESAARGLAAIGLAWDGARLAGHAAGHVDERRDMTRLLACARELRHVPTTTEQITVVAVDDDHERTLTDRERDVARHVLAGRNYREIGATMFISPRTVEHHVARMRARFGASTRSELLDALRAAVAQHDDAATGAHSAPIPLHPRTESPPIP